MEKSETINHTYSQFDHLPSAGFVDIKTVKALYSCSVATVWREVNCGRIPKPYKLSLRNTRWNVGELREALALKEAV